MSVQIYKKILVTIDCSDVDGPIVAHVRLLAQQNNAQVVLMHVIHAHTVDQDRVLRDKAARVMEVRLAEMRVEGVEVQSIITDGEPEAEILKEIETGGYDLVAMATHGHTLIGDILFGSVSKSLKHKINIPLLLLKAGGRIT
jgi:nucleotide-binding universal stress UspA family protein